MNLDWTYSGVLLASEVHSREMDANRRLGFDQLVVHRFNVTVEWFQTLKSGLKCAPLSVCYEIFPIKVDFKLWTHSL